MFKSATQVISEAKSDAVHFKEKGKVKREIHSVRLKKQALREEYWPKIQAYRAECLDPERIR
jgi:hypothetical protein